MSTATAAERDFERELRNHIMDEIREQGMTVDEVAHRTGMLPSGVEALFQRRVWPISVAFRVARGLGLEVRPVVESR